MDKIFFTMLLPFCLSISYGQGNPAYLIYNSKGKKVSYKKMIKSLEQSDMILFGEFHNNPISHWLQLEVTEKMSESRQLILGAEMFEADNQDALNKYVYGEIDADVLDTLARLWSNFKTDYKPLVDVAREAGIKFIATNVPRRYARQVFREGLESLELLPDEDTQWIAPLPILFDINLPGYQEMLKMGGGDHSGENFPKAQAIKDATMGHFIMTNYEPGKLFIHYNGAYHSDNYEGILWYLKQADPSLNYKTITTVQQKDIQKLEEEFKGKADFIICVKENMTKTY